ncbi:iron-sulfur cluster-binding protein [Desulfarculus baarsii DSM 2075]|uniref:Iron-sulfur cluster-binding protein n=1 Tax=Desulfarculus baarsii (strain ATCC 33931 / DSM 2075 / LMG 7858 / VKM B-1802 / 2st14) TaxID=644282 RepID=E1QI69_DESB2|nr:hypothetical protein [Desulfarculus baarsii]ADK85386.1 iron-sulfur cluster-binding protein [Desulfarculus baarsii DSM 2075]
MKPRAQAPGGALIKVLYGLAVLAAAFSGLGQMPLTKRYYIADLPGMAWSADFYRLSELHYVAVALLAALFGWRLGLKLRANPEGWSWGPRTWWGWTLLALLALTGAVKVAANAGVLFAPWLLVAVNFTHLFCGMAFAFTALGALFRPKPKSDKLLLP